MIVGGTITALSSYILERRREERERERELRDRKIELKRAARLIEMELSLAQLTIMETKKTGDWWPSEHSVELKSWEEYRKTLAAELTDVAWGSLNVAAVGIKLLDTFRSYDAQKAGADQSMPKVDASSTILIDKVKPEVDAALKIIGGLTN